MLNVVMLNVVMLNVAMLNVIMLNVVMLNAIMLNVVMLNAIMLSNMAPKFGLDGMIADGGSEISWIVISFVDNLCGKAPRHSDD
jgi:hypothetical protein